jgi:hypothetical protein
LVTHRFRKLRYRAAVPVAGILRELSLGLRRVRGHEGRLPDFLIIGAQKSATTSLYRYLCEHPAVEPALVKEVHFFDHSFRRGPGWYRRHFRDAAASAAYGRRLTGEASPYYLVHPAVPARVAAMLPDVRLIVLLRDPVARAISHYHHEFRRGFESLGLMEALEQEETRIQGEAERLCTDPHYRSYAFEHYTYKARGRYAEQLARWMRHFETDQLLVLEAEHLQAAPLETLDRVAAFLGLESWRPNVAARHNPGGVARVPQPVLDYLESYFAPHQAQLEELLGDSSIRAKGRVLEKIRG